MESLDVALEQAVFDQEYNQAYPVSIRAVDGSFCYQRGAPYSWDGELDKMMAAVRTK